MWKTAPSDPLRLRVSAPATAVSDRKRGGQANPHWALRPCGDPWICDRRLRRWQLLKLLITKLGRTVAWARRSTGPGARRGELRIAGGHPTRVGGDALLEVGSSPWRFR